MFFKIVSSISLKKRKKLLLSKRNNLLKRLNLYTKKEINSYENSPIRYNEIKTLEYTISKLIKLLAKKELEVPNSFIISLKNLGKYVYIGNKVCRIKNYNEKK